MLVRGLEEDSLFLACVFMRLGTGGGGNGFHGDTFLLSVSASDNSSGLVVRWITRDGDGRGGIAGGETLFSASIRGRSLKTGLGD